MASLDLILLFEHAPHHPLWLLPELRRLARTHQLTICAVYNGQPYDWERQLRPLTTAYRALKLPLRLQPRLLLADLLTQPLARADARLWFAAESLWPWQILNQWLAEAPFGPVPAPLLPMPLPAQKSEHRRLFQARAQAIAQESAPPELVSVSLLTLPPCLFWHPAQDEQLRNWLPGGEALSAWIDTRACIWSESPPPAADPELSCSAAAAAWADLQQSAAPDPAWL
ncbi:MAG TPA: hypothetical protein V6D23_19005, partial [Candidatus Obscuribacterales bacterium]